MATTTKKKKPATKKVAEPEHRSLLGESNQLAPAREIYNGYEIEKRWVLIDKDTDYTKQKNGITLYDEALRKGERIEQGYLSIEKGVEMASELGIVPDFKPNTIRLRSIGNRQFILTLKDKKATKRREVEWELDKKTFLKYWKLTKNARVIKTRLTKDIKGNKVEFDAFTDRFLLMAEIEVKDEAALEKLPKLSTLDVTADSSWTNKKLAK